MLLEMKDFLIHVHPELVGGPAVFCLETSPDAIHLDPDRAELLVKVCLDYEAVILEFVEIDRRLHHACIILQIFVERLCRRLSLVGRVIQGRFEPRYGAP